MENSFKRNFCSSMISVLIMVSILIGNKYTNFLGLVISVNYITVPFIFLCLLLLINYCNKSVSLNSYYTSLLINIITILGFVFIIRLGAQNTISDSSYYVNNVFDLPILYSIGNIVSLFISGYVLLYIFEYFRIIGFKLFGTIISLLISLTIFGIIEVPFALYQNGIDVVINIILSSVIMSGIMALFMSLLYLFLKDKEYPYEENKIFIQNIPVNNKEKDKSLTEIIKIGETNEENKPKKRKNTTKKTKKVTEKTNNKKKTKKEKTVK